MRQQELALKVRELELKQHDLQTKLQAAQNRPRGSRWTCLVRTRSIRPVRSRCGSDHRMTTYVIRNGALIEKHLAPPLTASRSAHVISDIAPFATQDGTAITSRAALRDYERANGVRQVGNDWAGSERPAFWDKHLAREKARGDEPPIRIFSVARNARAPAGLILSEEANPCHGQEVGRIPCASTAPGGTR